MKVLMVCLGNICRSPLAEGILRSKVLAKGLNWEIDSAGTGAWHIGNPPDRRSIKVAEANGINIIDQRARQFKSKDLNRFDLVLAMDSSNYGNILRLSQNEEQQKKVFTILEFSNSHKADVPDPYYNDNGFEHVYQLLDQACEQLIKRFQ